MTYPFVLMEPIPKMVGVYGPWGPLSVAQNAIPASSQFEAANRTLYFPIFVPTRCVIQRFWWANGSTVAGTSTITAAIYTDVGGKPGRRLATAGTTQGTASSVQFVSLGTPLPISPGLYWMALASTAQTSTHIMRVNVGASISFVWKYQEAIGTPPATATPVKASGADMQQFGFSTVTSP